MANPKKPAASPDEGAEQVLYLKTSARAPERVLASFPLDADPSLIEAVKVREINLAHASGLDVHALEFRVGREAI